MKTELEVARDAVRSAGLEELADALEWAAAAVRHRRPLMFAANLLASGQPCNECGAAFGEVIAPFDRLRVDMDMGALVELERLASPQPAQPQPEDEPADE